LSKTILVVVAHADDEALGCGGTIARHVSEGNKVHVLILADGVSSRGKDINCFELEVRHRAFENAKNILGVQKAVFLGYPDNKMDTVPLLEVVKRIEREIDELKPETIYTHHYGDLNIDHRITHQAVMTACRATPSIFLKEILTFEVMSSTEWNSVGVNPFIPNLFVDISFFLDIKIKSLEAYSEEMRQVPHSRSLEHQIVLARHRGYSVGLNAAEAFMVMRILR